MSVGCGAGAARAEAWDGARAAADAPEPEWEVRRFLFVVRETATAYGGADAALPDPTGARADALLELGDRIAELARSIQVAEAEMMRLIVEFDRERGWAEAGFGSCAEWLALRIGIGANAARERVRTARALEALPLTTAAMEAGTLSYAKARSLTRVATPESEEALLALAQAGSAEHLERVVRAWKAMDDSQELAFEQMRHRNRRFSVYIDDAGSYVVKGRLEPEVGALLMRAVEAASDALYREERRAEGAEGGTWGADGCGAGATATDVGTADAPAADDCATRAGLGPGDTTPAQRRADAVGLLAERALAAGFGDDAVRGSRADRYQVMLHVEPDTLRSDRPSGRSELDGVRVSRETSRRLTCDAAVVTIEEGPETAGAEVHDDCGCDEDAGGGARRNESRGGAPRVTEVTSVTPSPSITPVAILGVGRRTRTVPPALRRALQARDRGCRFPGCGSRFAEAHHIVHWADGGATELRNLVLLCLRHHRAVHEGGMRICMDRQASVVFFTAQGRAVGGTPAPGSVGWGGQAAGAPRSGSGAATPVRPLPPAPPLAAAYPGADGYRRDRDIPWTLEARAREALDAG